MLYAIFVVIWFFAWTIIIAKRYFHELILYWEEPVLKFPVLIFESDDWGAGPLQQADALTRISSTLIQFSDKHGHHPIMTIGVVLSIPDADKIKNSEFKTYFARCLNHQVFLPIKKAMSDGLERGALDLQLHGMAHYWPDNLLRSLQTDAQIRYWLVQEEFPKTEDLPSTLQSRWINTDQLPTNPLNRDEIRQAVQEEVFFFKELFGFSPQVVVPPTFVWNQHVEDCWKQQSLNYLVTPGRCFDRRDKEGKPCGPDQKVVNGQLSDSGLIYIVRNDYFEPSLGHTAEVALKALDRKTRLAQPTILETHRFNFIQNDKATETSFVELEKTISWALEKYPNLMFLSTKELADKYASNDNNLIDNSYLIRLLTCTKRLWANNSIRKWLYISGLFLPFLYLIRLRQ